MISLLFAVVSAWRHDSEFDFSEPPQVVLHAVQDAQRNLTFDSTNVADDDKCKQCVMAVSAKVVTDVMERISKACEEKPPKVKWMKKFCWLVANKPKVVVGMVIFWTHPINLAGAYCVGHGDCSPKSDPSAHFDIEDDMKFKLGQVVREVTLSSHSDDSEHLLMALEKEDCNGYEEEEDDDDEIKPRPDHKCMKCVGKKVMEMTIKKVEAFCKKTKCEHAQKICKWAEEHKDEAFGFLLAAVEPWKFAIGYCWPHPHHRHHDRHDRHHGGHHDHHDHHASNRYHHEAYGEGEDVMEGHSEDNDNDHESQDVAVTDEAGSHDVAVADEEEMKIDANPSLQYV